MLTMHCARSLSEEIARMAGLPGLPSAQLHVSKVLLCEFLTSGLEVSKNNNAFGTYRSFQGQSEKCMRGQKSK